MKSQNHWSAVRVSALRDLTPTVREIVLQPVEGVAQHWAPGAHLQLRVRVAGREQTRSYSLVGLPADVPGAYRIAVKRLADGRGGSMAMWDLAVGDVLPASAPNNHFPLSLDAPGTLLIAGGIGITPLVGMACQLRERGTPVRLLYAARSAAELAYADDLRVALGDALVCASSDRGERLDLLAALAALPMGSPCYVCGPAGLLDAVREVWAAQGRAPADLRFETFGSGGRLPTGSFQVKVPRHGVDITVAAGESLLDALEAAGVPVMSDCRRGECGLCAMDVVDLQGEIDHRDVFLSEGERQGNQRLCACVSRVVGSVCLDSAYRPDGDLAAQSDANRGFALVS
ncbi:MAG: oxidoreductase [Hydrogenophaga sp.]|uniref:PDR/VanB family oxidoreductase n=1 Tax=Hydrogenophaga sp. TaxID=1904254 RepID=UPI001DE87AAB|nr:PDR/VanB family oxidoreductase [Hydrogenophaga sp.]MBX3611812.1 oxidoreductase [Hydrogenophaga sp.]